MSDGYQLSRFSATDMVLCGAGLRRSTAGCSSLEQSAGRIVRYLREVLRGPDGELGCALVRFYQTVAFEALGPDLQRFAAAALAGAAVRPDLRCLTLMGTAGEEPSWNSRHESAGHRAIPLPSTEAISRLPMVSRLLSQLGVAVAGLEATDSELVMEPENRRAGVFHVPEAAGSPYVPAQTEFVGRYGIRSIVGFGGGLASGELYAIVLFARIAIPRASAALFKHLAGDVKIAILPSLRQPLFGSAVS